MDFNPNQSKRCQNVEQNQLKTITLLHVNVFLNYINKYCINLSQNCTVFHLNNIFHLSGIILLKLDFIMLNEIKSTINMSEKI